MNSCGKEKWKLEVPFGTIDLEKYIVKIENIVAATPKQDGKISPENMCILQLKIFTLARELAGEFGQVLRKSNLLPLDAGNFECEMWALAVISTAWTASIFKAKSIDRKELWEGPLWQNTLEQGVKLTIEDALKKGQLYGKCGEEFQRRRKIKAVEP